MAFFFSLVHICMSGMWYSSLTRRDPMSRMYLFVSLPIWKITQLITERNTIMYSE